jgi:hypothetical protein
LQAYRDALDSVGIAATIMGERHAVHWDDTCQWVSTPSDVVVLELGEAPYVIAQSFSITRLAGPSAGVTVP